jgi:hypothetical protein
MEEDNERSPKSHSIHIIMRKDEDGDAKVTEIEKKNIKKRFIQEFEQFPEDEEGFEDSKAA